MDHKFEAIKAYGDSHGRISRDLNWKGEFIYGKELASWLGEVIPSYNEFDGDTVAETIKGLPSHLQYSIAREGSVALYIKGFEGTEAAELMSTFNRLGADELDILNDEIRIWWD